MGGPGPSEAREYDSYASLRLGTIGVKPSLNTSSLHPKQSHMQLSSGMRTMQPEVSSSYCFGFGLQCAGRGGTKKHRGCGKEAESQAEPQEPQPNHKPWFQDARHEAVMLSPAHLLPSTAPCCPCVSAVYQYHSLCDTDSICTGTYLFCTFMRQQSRQGNA